jgi:Leucine-rich repeat (LRR) protein
MTDMPIQNDTTDEAQMRIRICRQNHAHSLDLSSLNLEYIPDEIKDLAYLKILNLSENNLTELPDFIYSNIHLECLDLSYNRITALPDAIESLTSLEILNVRCNELAELPETIGKLVMLTSLDISHNRLAALPETVDKLTLLEQCNIRGNNLQNIPERIGRLIKPKQLATFEHMEKIIELTAGNGLSDSFFFTAKVHIQHIAQKLNITPLQAVLFSHIVAEYDDNPVRLDEIARSLGCNKIRLMQYAEEFTELENIKLIRSCKNFNRHSGYGRGAVTYRVPSEVTASLAKDEEYHPVNYKNLTIEELLSRLEELFEQRVGYQEISYETLLTEINSLLDDNQQLLFVKKTRDYNLTPDSLIILLRFCHYFVNMDEDEMSINCLEDLYDHKSCFAAHKRRLLSGEHLLIAKGLIENTNSDGFSDRESFKLTEKTKNELLADLQIKRTLNIKDLILAKTIQKKTLFYNEREKRQIDQFLSLLEENSFKKIQNRLVETGMRTGFACLFSGPAGTGKTETVYQIARQTGRDVMMVDISQTKSMWFGESEKKIKEIFTRYQNYAEKAEVTPILLFNEADAVFGRRKDVSVSAVAQTENAIQNIILQELENLKGILIATANLTENMDKAFERRFLYKIEFRKPDSVVRQSIWQSMIPSLSVEHAQELASRFDFSGGQIENIARKRTIAFVLSGEEPSLDDLVSFCKEELLSKDSAGTIGFVAQ